MIQKINLLPLEEDDDITIKRVVVKLPKEEKVLPLREWYELPLVIIQEVLYLFFLIELCTAAYIYLSGYPVYKIVSFVILFIIWSNIAVATARNKTKEKFFVGERQSKKDHIKSVLAKDTEAYLIALKIKLNEKGNNNAKRKMER